MALQFDYLTNTVTVPQADLTFISGTLYDFDTQAFHLLIGIEQASEQGMPYVTALQHNTEITVVGATFARFLQLINGWSLTFEDGQYTVRLINSNNNFFDVAGSILNQNQVQVIAQNSFGLTVPISAQGVRDAMQLETTDGEASVDVKLGINAAISAAAL